MANGLTYPTGVSAQPIDVSSGASAFMQSAVESRLKEIAASQKQISENKKNVLNALSIKALPDLARAQRDRYQTEIEDYRKSVIDKFKQSQGKLTLQQQKEIQDGFVDMQSRMAAESQELKQFDSAKKALLNPNARFLYDTDRAEEVMGNAYGRLMRGEGLGDFTAELATTMRAPSTGEFISKTYAPDIESLDLVTLGNIKGNIFKKEELRGLDLPQGYEESIEKAVRMRDNILQESFFRNQYTNSDGTINQEVYQEKQQEVEDIINRRREEVQKGYAPRAGTTREVFVGYEPDTETISVEAGEIKSTYGATVPTTGVTSFSHEGDRVAIEAVQYLPVAKSESNYNKNISGTKPKDFETPFFKSKRKQGKAPGATYSEHRIIADEDLGKYSREDYEYKPFAKLVVPKEKGLFFRTIDDLAGKKTEVKFTPFEGKVEAAVADKMGTKRDLYFEKINEANARLKTKAADKKYTEAQERGIDRVMKVNNISREDAINALVNAGKL